MRPWPVPVPSIVLVAFAASVCLGANTARAQDRYGPPEPATAPQESAQPSPSVYLYWPGKPTAPASPAAMAVVAPPAVSPPAAPTSIYAPPAAPARAAPPPWETAAYAPSAAPQGPRDAAAPPATQAAAGPQAGLPPRFYSVQRQYGVAATVPLSPQFLADSASTDLAAPPPAPPVLSGQASTTSTAAAIRQRQADEDVADDASQSPQP